jgi:2-polyprenyl-6-hydroxyphenyl methylase/3-demethylubiquinone-9 3-methyltransferase
MPWSAGVSGSDLELWGVTLRGAALNASERDYLLPLPPALPDVGWLWAEMDRIWAELGLDEHAPLGPQPVGAFYGHPVWIANGVFTAADPTSLSVRGHIADAVAACLARAGASRAPRVCDFGGGFGELARALAGRLSGGSVDVVEPFPSRAALARLAAVPGVRVVDTPAGVYDAATAQDVLEHVEDPVAVAFRIAEAVRQGGFVVFANCFEPVIRCHLPRTFHLRHTFVGIMRAMGLRHIGRLPGARDVVLFERVGPLDLEAARRIERRSRMVGPAVNGVLRTLSRLAGR